ncbi:hypothetical protein EVB87_092 [Rhizobium phage RHph_N28_1]|nr:hypothetical protein EVB87_092 [Rhizobium phage RHph_N28_1]QIG74120.1 hypothetical protein EVC07_092 [Rhizobium phage RHph_N42]QXV73779.1 hypothetical protein [Rhizobium phage RHph_N46]
MKSTSFYLDEYETVAKLREVIADIEEHLRNSNGRIDSAEPIYHKITYEFTTGRYMMTLTMEQPT